MQEEAAVEERMDFVMLSSTIKPVTATALVPGPSVEEKEMWDNYSLSNEIFDAGINHTVATVEERRRLEREATNFDIWRGADLLPEDPNDGELLLDELEQDDILTELLRNTCTCITIQLLSLMLIVFWGRCEGA